MNLHLLLLGNVEIRREGVPITGFNSSKTQALLCYLAMTGRPHLRPALVGLLWADMPEANAQRNLRKALANLRKLAGSHLSITRQAVAFNRGSPYWLDVETFETRVKRGSVEADIALLQEAVELYRGDFLEGFYVRHAPAFEEWARAQQSRLRELAMQALHTLAAHSIRQGEAGRGAGIDYITRLLALEPWREEAHRQLMLLLALTGQRGAALAQYETCRQVLAEKFGVEPGTETTALYEKIRAGDPEIGEQWLGEALPVSVTPPPHLRPELRALPFLEPDEETAETTGPIFITREWELSELAAVLTTARAGQGQILFVIGGAGRGKTTLVQEFVRRALEIDAGLVAISGNCNAYTGLGDPYLPFREALTMLMGEVEARWAAGRLFRQQAKRLWVLLPLSVPALLKVAPDLLDSFIPGQALLDRAATVAPPETPWLKRLTMQVAQVEQVALEQKRIFAQYTAVLKAIAAQRPLLLLLEDLQWVDAASSGLLFHLSREVGDSRILILGTYRPEEVALRQGAERHPLADLVGELKRRHGDIWLDLGDLAPLEGRRFVNAYLDTQPNRLGDAFRETLFRQTDGHPLFTVELLRAMQDRGDLRQDEDGYWLEGQAINWGRLPAKVEGVIETRVDRLGEALQTILAVASVEGETFTVEVVARILGVEERELVQRLSRELDKRHRLVRAQSLERLGQQRLSRYRFRHYLFQQYLYHRLDEMERAYLHEAVGQALEALYGERAGEIAAQLAQHFQDAGLPEKAISYLPLAGERAVRLSAYKEAIDHFSRGLALLETLPATPEHIQQELTLQLALGNALTAAKGFAAPEVGKAYTRAQALCRQIGETLDLFPTLFGLWQFYATRAELQTARELGERLLSLAQGVQQPELLLQAHHALWTTSYFLGELSAAGEYCEQGLALYKRQQPTAQAFLHYGGHDPGVCGRSFGGPVLWFLGYPDQALRRSQKGLGLAQDLAHPFSLTQSLYWLATLHQLRREVLTAQEQAEKAISLATRYDFPLFAGWAMSVRGWALAQQGQAEAGIAQLHAGIATYQATGAMCDQTHLYALLAEVYGIAGQIEKGLSAVTEGLRAVDKTGECFYEAELYRLKGELLLKQEHTEAEIEACYHQALAIARRQDARSLELRAAMSLYRLWQQHGKHDRAHRLLLEIYACFAEGLDTADLIEAKMLLEG